MLLYFNFYGLLGLRDEMKSSLVMLAIVSSLVGCHSAQREAEERAKSALGELLLDPNSVQLRTVHIGKKYQGKTTVCGEVNAKNAMGGYAGFKPFLVAGTVASIEKNQHELTLGYVLWRKQWSSLCGTAEDLKEAKDLEATWTAQIDAHTRDLIRQQQVQQARYRELTGHD